MATASGSSGPTGVFRDACGPYDAHALVELAGRTVRVARLGALTEAGLLEDETLAFADTIGFRAGTARSYPAFDLLRGETLSLRVKPLHVMDIALARAAASPDEASAHAVEMERLTRAYGGTFSILWHNSRLETPRARQRYSRLLAALRG